MTKKRAFEATEPDTEEAASGPPAATTERTEPAPQARTAVALVLLSWLVPLGMFVSLLAYTEGDPGTRVLHRTLTVVSVGLLLAGLGLAIRAIARARRDVRIRRRLAVAALLLGLLTPVVWASELMLAWETFVTRDAMDAAASSAPDE